MSKHIVSFNKERFVEIEEFPSILHSMVLPLVLIKQNQMRLIGTAFIVNPVVGLAVTAAHCISEVYNDLDNITEKDGAIGLIYIGKHNEKVVANILDVKQVYMERYDNFDVAILKIKIPVPAGSKDPNETLLKAFKLDFSLPELGDKCLALGYNKDTTASINMTEKEIEIFMGLKASEGLIEEILLDNDYKKYPCIRINNRVDKGMSGGPIISSKTGSIIGITSTGFEIEEGGEYTEFISHTSCLFPLCVNMADDQEDNKPIPFFELARRGVIYSTDSFKEIVFDYHVGSSDLNIILPAKFTLSLQNYWNRFSKK